MRSVPFTVKADLNLGTRVTSYLAEGNADVIIAEGEVPAELDEVTYKGVSFVINQNQVLLTVPRGARYLIEGGEKITYQRNGKTDLEVALFLLGSAWGALCYQRSLLPLHASAVVADGKVHAFTGPSGAGKSTLAASLAREGFDFFSDDVLIIDPLELGPQTPCYSGQKDLKLWQDALKLTGSEALGAVRDVEGFNKYYALPQTYHDTSVGILATLSILRNDNIRRGKSPLAFENISGGKAMMSLRGSVYRPKFASAIWGLPKYYEILSRLIAAVQLQTFDRPLVRTEFDKSTAFAANWLREYSLAKSETSHASVVDSSDGR